MRSAPVRRGDILGPVQSGQAAVFVIPREGRNGRDLAARMLDWAGAGELPLEKDQSGRPHLPGGNLAISWSYSDEWTAGVIARADAIGIDIEDVRDRMASRRGLMVTDAERELLADCDAAGREHCWFRIWTAKEAIVKAAGLGIKALGRTSVSASAVSAPGGPSRAWELDLGEVGGTKYSLSELQTPPGLAATLASTQFGLEVVWPDRNDGGAW